MTEEKAHNLANWIALGIYATGGAIIWHFFKYSDWLEIIGAVYGTAGLFGCLNLTSTIQNFLEK